MEQLIAHFIGDYILQSHDMATKKVNQSLWCLYHCLLYTLPFIFFTQNLYKLFIIFFTHYLIDRFRLARYVIISKNFLFGSFKIYNTKTGFPENTPDWLAVWLLIIVDNTLHILINHFVLNF